VDITTLRTVFLLQFNAKIKTIFFQVMGDM